MQSFAGSLERSRLSKVRASTAEQKRLTLLSGNTRFPISRFISDNHKAGGGWGGGDTVAFAKSASHRTPRKSSEFAY